MLHHLQWCRCAVSYEGGRPLLRPTNTHFISRDCLWIWSGKLVSTGETRKTRVIFGIKFIFEIWGKIKKLSGFLEKTTSFPSLSTADGKLTLFWFIMWFFRFIAHFFAFRFFKIYQIFKHSKSNRPVFGELISVFAVSLGPS
jgi:hypothetical protein